MSTRIGIRTLLSHRFYLRYIVTKLHFLSSIFFNFTDSISMRESSTLINLGFLIKKDFSCMVLILDFTGLNVCITFINVQNFNWI